MLNPHTKCSVKAAQKPSKSTLKRGKRNWALSTGKAISKAKKKHGKKQFFDIYIHKVPYAHFVSGGLPTLGKRR